MKTIEKGKGVRASPRHPTSNETQLCFLLRVVAPWLEALRLASPLRTT